MSRHDEFETGHGIVGPVGRAADRHEGDGTLSPKANVSVSVMAGRDRQLPDLAEAWQQCLAGAPEHQQLFTHAFIAAWLRHETDGNRWTGESRVLVARTDDGTVVGILPLACRRFGLLRVWMLAGPYEPVRGFVCHASLARPVCEAFARKLVGMHVWLQSVRLGPIDTGFPECAELVAAMQRATRRFTAFDTPVGIYDGTVPATLEEFQSRIKASRQLSRVASRQRRLEREEGLRIERYRNPTGGALRTILLDCRAVEQRSWLATAPDGRLRFASDAQIALWCDARDGAKGADLDVWVVYLENQPIAFDIVLTTGSHRYLYAGQYDKDHGKLGLGWMLYMAYTQEGIERGVKSIDMGPGSIEYKQQIGGVTRDLRRDVGVLPGGPLGMAAAALASSVHVRKLMLAARRLRQRGWRLSRSLPGRQSSGTAAFGGEFLLRNWETVGCEIIHCTGAASVLSLVV